MKYTKKLRPIGRTESLAMLDVDNKHWLTTFKFRFRSFQTSFYADPVDAIVKALGMD